MVIGADHPLRKYTDTTRARSTPTPSVALAVCQLERTQAPSSGGPGSPYGVQESGGNPMVDHSLPCRGTWIHLFHGDETTDTPPESFDTTPCLSAAYPEDAA